LSLHANAVSGRRIIAESSSELVAKLTKLGYEPARLFFKCERDWEKDPALSGSYSTMRLTDFGAQFQAMERLNVAIPENTPKPLLLVMDGEEKPAGIVMEKVEGTRLDSIRRRLSNVEYSEAFTQLKGLVRSMHEKLTAHGDLEPANIIMTPDRKMKLIDPSTLSFADAKVQDENFMDEMYMFF
jgi:RIO-like serine/threonine protein kinase